MPQGTSRRPRQAIEPENPLPKRALEYRGDRINSAHESDFVDLDITRVSRSHVESAVGDPKTPHFHDQAGLAMGGSRDRGDSVL
jgi:hypothetical protein